MARSCFLSVTAAIGLGLGLAAADGGDTTRIEHLITQLGSVRFTEREAASRSLDAIGAAALDALKQARTSDDAELRHRAEELIGKIEMERILAPTKVHLVCKDTRIDDIVAELRKQSGETVSLRAGATQDSSALPITFDSSATTYWQALDRFCQAANLSESDELVAVTHSDGTSQARTARILRPAEGTVAPLPTHYAGPLRLRALPEKAAVGNAGEIALMLGLAIEAKTVLEHVRAVRVDKAIDDQGQLLSQVAGSEVVDSISQPVYLENTRSGPRGVVQSGDRRIPIRLQRGEQSTVRLKELSGVLTAEARTTPETLLTVNDILKATSQLLDARDGARLSVLEVEPQSNGDLRLRVEIFPPPDRSNEAVPRRGRFSVRVQAGGPNPGRLDFISESHVLRLLDANGKTFAEPSELAHTMRISNNVVSHELTLQFPGRDGQAEAAKLVYHGPRSVAIEVPFTLKDVPLP
jgi:hypothetical protein